MGFITNAFLLPLKINVVSSLQEPYLEELKPELTEEEFIKFVEPIIQVRYCCGVDYRILI